MSYIAAPVAAGLAIGIGFVVLFASLFSTPVRPLAEYRFLKLEIDGMKEIYLTNEKIDFVVKAQGHDIVCGFPKLRILSENGTLIHHNSDIITLVLCDPAIRDINETWTLSRMGFGQEITIPQGGNYKVIVSYGDSTIQKEFTVVQFSGMR
ncbi:MAG: hypothetical protein HRF40_12540 [Nitrososphaera sp.]